MRLRTAFVLLAKSLSNSSLYISVAYFDLLRVYIKGTYTKTVYDLAGDMTSYSENIDKNNSLLLIINKRLVFLKALIMLKFM